MRKILVATPLILALILIPTPAAARAHQDAKGDVASALDLVQVSLTWTDEKVTATFVTAEDFTGSDLDFMGGGNFQFEVRTHKTPSGYDLYYSTMVYRVNGSYEGFVTESGTSTNTRTLGEPTIKRVDARTLKVSFKRSWMRYSSDGKRFGYWFMSSWAGGGPAYIEDYSPEGDALYNARF